jgi:hypothetical protein
MIRISVLSLLLCSVLAYNSSIYQKLVLYQDSAGNIIPPRNFDEIMTDLDLIILETTKLMTSFEGWRKLFTYLDDLIRFETYQKIYGTYSTLTYLTEINECNKGSNQGWHNLRQLMSQCLIEDQIQMTFTALDNFSFIQYDFEDNCSLSRDINSDHTLLIKLLAEIRPNFISRPKSDKKYDGTNASTNTKLYTDEELLNKINAYLALVAFYENEEDDENAKEFKDNFTPFLDERDWDRSADELNKLVTDILENAIPYVYSFCKKVDDFLTQRSTVGKLLEDVLPSKAQAVKELTNQ